MSTEYIIVDEKSIDKIQVENGYVLNLDEFVRDIHYTRIGGTWHFDERFRVILGYLSDKTPIFASDNNTDIKTLGELKEYYAK